MGWETRSVELRSEELKWYFCIHDYNGYSIRNFITTGTCSGGAAADGVKDKTRRLNKTLVFEIEKLQYELTQYKQLVHGAKHETLYRRYTLPEQLALGLNAEPTHIIEVEQIQKIEAPWPGKNAEGT